MSYFNTSSKENGKLIQLYYEDYGSGKPVILIHGWPLSGAMFEQQKWALVEGGYRCITYDRRGFGKSDFPWDGYDYDTLSSDLNDLISHLNLTNVTLVGFSMGGGEVARYVGNYGTSKLDKVIFLSSIAPFMLQTEDNPDGVPKNVFEGFKDELETDRLDFLKGFGKNFVNYEDNKDIISEALLDYTWNIAAHASPKGTIDCVNAFGLTDLREDVKKIDIPCLFIHGTEDEVVPPKPTAQQGHELVKNSKLEMIEGAPHGCVFAHKDKVNQLLLNFLNK